MARLIYDNKCKLPDYTIEPLISLLGVNQKTGWNITAFNLPDTWSKTQGEGVKIALLDTGVDLDHPDLKENLLPGYNAINPKKPPVDVAGHGTHCAGIICAINNDIGMVGVAPKAKIIPVKVLGDNGSGNLNHVIKGINWAISQKVDIISMSLGTPSPLNSVHRAIKKAAKKGIPTFCAAGNAGQTKAVFYPANYPETIAIGSIDKDMGRSNFSNTGKNLDFMAPGGKIFSTIPDNWYGELSGTSMACPFAVGVAALILSYARKNKTKIKLKTVQDYRNLFKQHTIPVTDKKFAGKKFFEGFGIIDPKTMLEYFDKKQIKMLKVD